MSEVTTIFNESLPERLNNRAEKVKKINAVYQFDIDGENGGTWTVDLTKDGDFVSEGPSEKADCTVTMKESDFVKMWKGELPGIQAFMMGKVKVQGEMKLAMKLQEFL